MVHAEAAVKARGLGTLAGPIDALPCALEHNGPCPGLSRQQLHGVFESERDATPVVSAAAFDANSIRSEHDQLLLSGLLLRPLHICRENIRDD